MPTFVAVDLGATSGRVVNVSVDGDGISLDLVRRFPNRMIVSPDGGATWDFETLFNEIAMGLDESLRRGPARSVAIDSWAVDYGLLDEAGNRLGPVHSYRSARTDGVMNRVLHQVGRDTIYAITGIQFLPFNTLYQLDSAADTAEYRQAASMLMIPDLVNQALCGSRSNEVTNASTTQLLDARTHEWSDDLVATIGLRRELLPELHAPGTRLGTIGSGGVDPTVRGLPVVAVASHDTASAVAGTPLHADRDDIYISCGTWALVGCELDAPVTTTQAAQANVTNELGWGGTTRLLKNVTGFWLLEECNRIWSSRGQVFSIGDLVYAADRVPGGVSVFDPDDPRLVGCTDMPAAIRSVCRDSGQPEPKGPAEITRAIVDSLALSFRSTVRSIEQVAGIRSEVIHLTGGGARNQLLARLTASACERPVLAGPAEATVVGNALVQAITDGVLADLDEGRRLVERSMPQLQYLPERLYDWAALETRLPGQSAL